MPARKIGSSGLLKKLSRSSSIEASVSAGVTLPSDLSKSLQYLDDAQLERLRAGVAAEINRRDQGAQKRQAGTAASSRAPPVRERRSARQEELPEGKANLIRASFNAGLKPATIARTFHLSQAVVSSYHQVDREAERVILTNFAGRLAWRYGRFQSQSGIPWKVSRRLIRAVKRPSGKAI